MSKYIKIIETETNMKTKVWCIINKKYKETLGIIYYYAPWRKYVFKPGTDTVWDCKCLEEIINFIEEIKK